VASLVELATEALGAPLKELATDGGAAAADGLLQAQADSCGLEVRRRADLESTSRGVALLAALDAGVVPGLEAWETIPGEPAASRFQPSLSDDDRQRWLKRWREAVRRSLAWHA